MRYPGAKALLKDPEWVRREYEAGRTPREMAELIGCSESAVYYRLVRYGVHRRPPGHQYAKCLPAIRAGYQAWRRASGASSEVSSGSSDDGGAPSGSSLNESTSSSGSM